MKIFTIIIISLAVLGFALNWITVRRRINRINKLFYYTAPGVRYCNKCNAEQINSKRGKKDFGVWVHGRGTKAALTKDCECLTFIKN